jgi:hypothetical protein
MGEDLHHLDNNNGNEYCILVTELSLLLSEIHRMIFCREVVVMVRLHTLLLLFCF